MLNRSCAAIVLAAGASVRLGKPKQLLTVDGESLLRRTARLAAAAGCSPVVVVLGANAHLFKAELAKLEVRVVNNQAWQEGMASSIRCGLDSVTAQTPLPRDILILVCDQPKLSLPVLQALLEKHQSNHGQITACSYDVANGVPAIFSETLFAELADLRGDEGARRIIAHHQVRTVDFPGGGDDIDTPADLCRVETIHTTDRRCEISVDRPARLVKDFLGYSPDR